MDEGLKSKIGAVMRRQHDIWTSTLGRHIGSVLSERQRAVAEAICNGLSDKEIAHALGCATKTTQVHVSAILTRLGLTSRTQVAAVLLKAVQQ